VERLRARSPGGRGAHQDHKAPIKNELSWRVICVVAKAKLVRGKQRRHMNLSNKEGRGIKNNKYRARGKILHSKGLGGRE